MIVFEAYLQGLLEKIAVQTQASGANQTEYSESRSSLVDQRINTTIIMGEGSHQPIIV